MLKAAHWKTGDKRALIIYFWMLLAKFLWSFFSVPVENLKHGWEFFLSRRIPFSLPLIWIHGTCFLSLCTSFLIESATVCKKLTPRSCFLRKLSKQLFLQFPCWHSSNSLMSKHKLTSVYIAHITWERQFQIYSSQDLDIFAERADGLGFKDKSNSPQNWIAGVANKGALEVLQSHTSRWSRHGPTTSSLAPANKKGQKCVNCLSWLQALDPWNKFANLHCDLSQEFFSYPHPGPWICADKFTQVGFRFKKFNVYF